MDSWGQIRPTKTLNDPLEWNRQAVKDNVVERVFANSLSDFFHAGADIMRPAAWNVIRECKNLVFMLLTKRPSRIMSHLPPDWGNGWPNVWLGVTAGCRKSLHNLDTLRKVPMHPRSVRWVSCEPLLESISQDMNLDQFGLLAAGGESGVGREYLWDPQTDLREELTRASGRRTMRLQWARDLRDKCEAENIKFMFKQVASAQSSKGMNALGEIYHQVPDHHLDGLPWRPQEPVQKKNLITPAQIAALWAEETTQSGMDRER
jgi:protein gp37